VPEPLERSAFLRKVADAVDLQPREVGEVLEELNSHLSDAAAGWRDAGYDPDDAERRAIRGLGDPAALGQELGKARHERRHLLAGVGGGIWSALTFGLWSFLFLWLIVGGVVLLASVAAISLLHGFNVSTPNWLSGPSGSLVTIAITGLWFGWMGWVLPERVARAAHRSTRGVRLAVGLTGFVIGSVVLWAMVPLTMDPVLALGLPLGPLAFLLAAQRPSLRGEPFPATTLRSRLGIAAAVVAVTVLLGVATMHPGPGEGLGYGVDISGIGAAEFPDLSGDNIPTTTYDVTSGAAPVVTASAYFPDDDWFRAYASRYPTTSLEVWPLVPTGSQLYGAGAAPLATRSVPSTLTTFLSPIEMPMPMPRTPQFVVIALVAVGADGSRVVFMPDAEMTPDWKGTLFDWWFGPR
jgi:hypothetical protein